MDASFPMAVVVTGAPLTITVEGASAVVVAEDLVGGLTTGDRVQAAFLGDRLAVLAKAGGAADTGWVDITASSGYTSNGAQARKRGDHVDVKGWISKDSGNFTTSYVTCGTLPAGMSPTPTFRVVAGSPASSTPRFMTMQVSSGSLDIAGGVIGTGNEYNILWLSGMSWDVA